MWMYEEGFHIPLIVRMPGGKPGRVNRDLVSMLDLAPTVLDLAGVKVPADIQGCSLKPLLMGAPTPWRDAFYYHYYGVVGKPDSRNWIGFHEIMGMRTKTAKLVYYPEWKGGPFWEHFDLAQDPREMTNLYHAPRRQEEITVCKGKLRELADRYKDPDSVKVK
jgi:arylsulfatase A-like enzyme